MSETTSLGLANPVMGLRKHGSIGVPFPGVDVRLVDLETGLTEVPQGNIPIGDPFSHQDLNP